MKQFLITLLLLIGGMPVRMSALSEHAQMLLQRQKDLSHTDSVEAFMNVTERLKTVLQEAGEEEGFYDAWNNQITYMLNNVSTSQTLKMVDEMRDYAEAHKSRYGFYIVTYLNAHIAKDLGMDDRAEELVLQSIDYRKHNLPNMKPMLQPYFFLSSVYGERKQVDKAVHAFDRALKQPGWSREDQIILWSLKCNAVTCLEPIDTARFMTYYQQMHAIMKNGDYLGNVVITTECYHAQLTGDYSRLLKLAQKLTDKDVRLKFKIAAYDGLGRNQEAIDSFKVYKEWTDQQFNAETRKLAEMSALELEAARAGNEAETLRLYQQRMMLIAIVSGLLLIAVFLAIYLRRRLLQMKALKQAYDMLEEVTTQKERIESELRIAHNIQMSMVPTVFPEHDAFDIFASMTPAKEVGGDLYDFFVHNDRLFFCIGDVSGKGVPAALLMTETKSLFRAYASDGSMPDHIVSQINNNLSLNNGSQMFVTLFVGILDLTSGLLRYCNAGHEDPVIVKEDAHFLPVNRIIPIGVIANTPYQLQEVVIEPHTTIFFYTDGLTEALNAEEKMFGEERILNEMNLAIQARELSPRPLIERMTGAVHNFVGNTEQSDDLTMLAINYLRQ
ncbi:MAG: serine/threonine-protein phosphatase [Prevotella sp.]|jgi:serine phosphatase RsbU (regulator of sigma subunit)|nr:serine/threonine-protein phosphatase [Prevotella sp.]